MDHCIAFPGRNPYTHSTTKPKPTEPIPTTPTTPTNKPKPNPRESQSQLKFTTYNYYYGLLAICKLLCMYIQYPIPELGFEKSASE